MNRLYCATTGGTVRFCISDTKEQASEVLGVQAKKPSPDELKRFWEAAGLRELSLSEAAEKVGVSRQTVWSWRQRIGDTNIDPRVEMWEARKAAVAGALQTQSTRKVAKELNVPRSTVLKIAKLEGLQGRGNAKQKA